MPGAKLRPMASAPARTAARIPAASVTPQIFTNGARAAAAMSIGSRPAATNDRAAAAGSGERISASPTSAASYPVARQRAMVAASRTPDSAIASRSPGISSRSRIACSGSTSSVRRSRLLTPTSLASAARAASSSPRVVGLDQRLQAEVPGLRGQPRQPRRRMEHGQQQHEVGPGGPEEVELPGIDDELLGEHGHGDLVVHGLEVVDGAAEPVGLAQHGDRGRAARGVGAGARDGVVRGRDVAGRRRAALDLGDQVQAGGRQRVDDRSRLRCRGQRPAQPVAPELLERPLDVLVPALGDLVDDVGRVRLRPLGDGHAGAPSGCAFASAAAAASAAALAASAIRRSSRSPARSSLARPASMVSAARSMPSMHRLDRARRDQRRPGVEQHDVASRAGLAAQHALGQAWRWRPGRRRPGRPSSPCRSPSARGSTRSIVIPSGVMSYSTPDPSSGSSSTPAPWTSERPLRPQLAHHLGELAAPRPRRPRRTAPAWRRPGSSSARAG